MLKLSDCLCFLVYNKCWLCAVLFMRFECIDFSGTRVALLCDACGCGAYLSVLPEALVETLNSRRLHVRSLRLLHKQELKD